MGLFGGSGTKLMGLDIGASAIKMVAGTMTKTGFSVEKLVIVPLPHRTVDDRGIVQSEAVTTALLAAFQQLGGKPPPVGTAVRGAGVLTKRIILSHFPKKEIPDQVRWEAEQVFPTDISTIFIDYVLLGEVASIPGAPAGTPGWDILLVGVRQDNVQTINGIIESITSLKCIDIDSFVVGDWVQDTTSLPPTEAIALVDVGASATRVSVRYKNNVTFIREFGIGGNAFTEAIAGALSLSFEDAESLKVQSGGGIPQEAQEALQGILQTWKSELQQCEDVFVTQDSQALISRWVIFGGAMQTPGLMELLRDEHFGSKVMPLEAANLLVPKGKTVDAGVLAAWAPRLVTAAGLACRKG